MKLEDNGSRNSVGRKRRKAYHGRWLVEIVYIGSWLPPRQGRNFAERCLYGYAADCQQTGPTVRVLARGWERRKTGPIMGGAGLSNIPRAALKDGTIVPGSSSTGLGFERISSGALLVVASLTWDRQAAICLRTATSAIQGSITLGRKWLNRVQKVAVAER
ncbi:hypothetical protein VTK56DRAFT_9259 [Thermocarpiscus australiensis]